MTLTRIKQDDLSQIKIQLNDNNKEVRINALKQLFKSEEPSA